MDVAALLAVAFVAGMLGGVVGVGGGVLFVPALVVLMELSQLEAQATSLVGVVAVGIVGAWRQQSYGNLRPRDALAIGLFSLVGVVVGVVAANELPERALEVMFAALSLYFAFGLARRALAPTRTDPASPSA
ncbi:MAG TPA: TSUP family transporter [Thermoleophilaceae bacterium]|nr:TSUP family transporter [Thermoleophilaceae bacterium]